MATKAASETSPTACEAKLLRGGAGGEEKPGCMPEIGSDTDEDEEEDDGDDGFDREEEESYSDEDTQAV